MRRRNTHILSGDSWLVVQSPTHGTFIENITAHKKNAPSKIVYSTALPFSPDSSAGNAPLQRAM